MGSIPGAELGETVSVGEEKLAPMRKRASERKRAREVTGCADRPGLHRCCEVVKLCQVVGVFPGARMNDGTEEGQSQALEASDLRVIRCDLLDPREN